MYKTISFLVVAVLLIVMRCNQKDDSQFASLQSSFESNPDSVYSVLQEMREEISRYEEEDRMRYGLLRLKCQNALGLPFDSKDATREIADYYATNGTYNEALQSTYLMGRWHDEADNKPMAIGYFSKCLSLKTPEDEDVDTTLLSKARSQLEEIYCEINDSVQARSLAEDISQIKAMYDYFESHQRTEEMVLQIETMRERSIVILSAILLAVLIGIDGIFIYRRKKHAEIDGLLEEYDRTLQMIEELNEDKEELLKRHEEDLEKIKGMLEEKGVPVSRDSGEGSVTKELLERFREYGDGIGTNQPQPTMEEWHSLMVEMANNDSQFMLLLSKSNLSENERKIAVLIRLYFKDYQIKRILDAYGSSLPNYKLRINKKLFGQSSAKTIRRMIYSYS